jgi:hypothetical protein
MTSQASATREAPAQAELRPTCTVASRLASPDNVALRSLFLAFAQGRESVAMIGQSDHQGVLGFGMRQVQKFDP